MLRLGIRSAAVGALRPIRNLCATVLFACFAGLFCTSSGQGTADGRSAAHPPADRPGFVGDQACLSCHQQQAAPYARTAHHLTSQLPSKSTILGSFTPPSNVLWIANPLHAPDEPSLRFEMTQTADGFYQSAAADLGDKHLMHTERIDLVFGSGVRGQTYLYWTGDQLSELPVSYWTGGHQWINSPGYHDGTANFSRHVDARCMQCHSTWIQALSSDPQSYSYTRSSLMPGISCETCHGAGADHVAFESAAAKGLLLSEKQTILNPARWDRDRQVDACALCHNGTQRVELKPAFSFIPGTALDAYLAPNPVDAADAPDVHGNQVGLLKRSACYRGSPSMSCSTCHDEHEPERSPASYSSRCLSCHAWQACGAAKTLGHSIVHDCIRCHMPLMESNAIVSVTAGRTINAEVRTHWIRAYTNAALSATP